MQCENCAYNFDQPSDAVCRRCGRYASNKIAHFIAVLGAAVALGVASNYLLTSAPFGGSKLIWLKQALTVPGSIYSDPVYLAAALVSLSGLLVVAALAGFHYGPLQGFLVALPMGIFAAVHLGWILLPLVATASALPRIKGVHPAVWPVAAVTLGGAYYLWLASVNGPSAERALLYRQALFVFLDAVVLAAVLVVGIAALASARFRFRAFYLPFLAAAFAVAPSAVAFTAAPPAALESNIITTLYSPRRSMRGPLGEGFIAGRAGEAAEELSPDKQLGHVFDVIRFVDARRVGAVEASNRYLDRFGARPGAPDIMLLKADMHNARIDMRALKVLNRLECYFDMVTPEADKVYGELIERFPATPQAALARFHKAAGKLQAGAIAEARARFVEAESALEGQLPEGLEPREVMPARSWRELFRLDERKRARRLNELHEALLSARRRISLIDANRDYAGRPLARFAALDERDEQFERKALQVLLDYPESRIADNVRLALAVRVRDPIQRSGQIEALLENYPQSDVRDRMLFELARAHRAGNLSGAGDVRAEMALRRLLADHPRSTWHSQARALLEKVAPAD